MAVVTPIVCFLMKFGTLQDVPDTPLEARYFETNARLWDIQCLCSCQKVYDKLQLVVKDTRPFNLRV